MRNLRVVMIMCHQQQQKQQKHLIRHMPDNNGDISSGKPVPAANNNKNDMSSGKPLAALNNDDNA